MRPDGLIRRLYQIPASLGAWTAAHAAEASPIAAVPPVHGPHFDVRVSDPYRRTEDTESAEIR